MASTFDKLPKDLLSDVLQRLPAKELCRFRTVCKSWRSITSNEAFIKAHAERHKETLFLAKFWDDETNVYVMDLFGDVVKRIASADGGLQVQRTCQNLACLGTDWNTCRLLNPATGRIQVFPVTRALCDVNGLLFQIRCTFFALGLVPSLREYKLLHCCHPSMGIGNLVHVLTISGGTDWRPRQGPRRPVDMHSGIVVDGVLYFFTLFHGTNDPLDDILSFDLANEQWRRDLHGPLSSGNVTSAEVRRSQHSLACLKGSLVLANHCRHLSTIDLWFLKDFESGLWVKEYNIWTESETSSLANIHQIIPLLALNDGRLVIYLASLVGLLFICDPGTNTFTRVHMRGHHESIGVYTGSLLSLQERDRHGVVL